MHGATILALAMGCALGGAARAATYAPDPILPSNLTIRLTEVAPAAPAGRRNDIASPVAIEGDLYIANTAAGIVTLRDASGTDRTVLDAASPPPGIAAGGVFRPLNIAGEGGRAYVTYLADSRPAGFGAAAPLPDAPQYLDANGYFELVYRYDRAPDGTLSNPEPLAAFEAADSGHRSSGMLVLPDGRLLYARGDQLRPDYNGLEAPQDPGSTVSKLIAIDPDTGGTEILAQGLRNVQRLTYLDAARTEIAFADIGWQVAEEINTVAVADLIDTAEIENFGWGVAADGLAREGTFYVNDGPEDVAAAIGVAPLGEAGFVQPFAQFGREGDGFFAVSGPVVSDVSFTTIGMLFGDLASGSLYATLAGASGIANEVYSVGVEGPDGVRTTLWGLFGDERDDVRFFNFADMGAGLLLERSGRMFRIEQIAMAAVPIPSGGWPLLLVLTGGALAGCRKRAG